MTTTSDGSPPPGAGLDPPFPDTAPLPLPLPLPPAVASAAPPPPPAELPPPPPLLSHLQPEAQAAAAAATPPGTPRRRLPTDTPSGAGRVILPIALCLVGVVAVGAGWIHLEADRAAEAQTRLAVAPSAKPPVPSLGAGTPVPTPAASTSSSSAPSAPPTAAASPTSSPSAAPSSSPSTAAVVDRSVPVVVLNATNRTGLAAAVAQRLRDKGWTIASVGNWRGGGVGTTTVFATGRAAAAATMRRDAKPADATRPTLAGMPKNRIVLVIGPDYPRVR